MRLRLPSLGLSDRIARRWGRLPWWGRGITILSVFAVLVIVPPFMSTYAQSVLFFPVGVYVLLALGLNVVVGLAGLLDLGYVAFYAVGAYTAAKVTTATGIGTWEAVVLAVLLAMVSGVVLGAPTLRLRGDYLAIVTLGFGEIVRIIALNSEPLGEARGIAGIPHPAGFLGIEFGIAPLPYYYVTLATVSLAVLMIVALTRSRVGRGWAAIREDEEAAEAMGVPTYKMKLWAFAIGATTGGLGGWVYASRASFVSPDTFTLFVSIFVLSGVVLGGLGSIVGVIAGAFAIGFLPEYLDQLVAGEYLTRLFNSIIGGNAGSISEYRVLLFGLILAVMMIFRPQGLFPSRQRAAEMKLQTGEGAGLAGAEVTMAAEGAEASDGS